MSEKSTDDLLAELETDSKKMDAKSESEIASTAEQSEKPTHSKISKADARANAMILVGTAVGIFLCWEGVCSWWWMFAFVFGSAAISAIISSIIEGSKPRGK